MQIDIIDTPHSLQALKPDWQRLWQAQERRCVFQHFEWIRAFIEAFAPPLHWKVLVARQGGVVTGLLPIAGDDKTGKWRLLGSPNADYQLVLAGPAETAALIRHVGTLGLKVLLLEAMPEGSLLLRLQQEPGCSTVISPVTAECHYTRLSIETVTAVQRRGGIKDNLRRLSKLGAVEMRVIEAAEDRIQALETLFSQHRTRWDARGKPSQFHEPATCDFYRLLCRSPDLAQMLHFSVLTVGGQPAACHFGFVTDHSFVYYKPTYDPAMRGAGQVHLSKLMSEALRLGVPEFDFTRGGEAYKASFATGVRHNYDARIFFSSRERLCHASVEWLRRHMPRDADGLALTTKFARRLKQLAGGR